MRKLVSCAFIIFSFIVGLSHNADALIFTDNFNDNSINSFWWTDTSGAPSTVAEQNSRLELTQGASGYARLTFNYLITGDFEAIVDYTLLNWPTNSNERFGMMTNVFGGVQRTDFNNEDYLVHFLPNHLVAYHTTDTSGSLKLKREGTTVSGYYWDNSSWHIISHCTAANFSNDTYLTLQMWPAGTYVNSKASFDNFYLNAPNMANPVPEPATLMLFSIGAIGAGLFRKRVRS